MNKADVIDALAKELKFSSIEAASVVETILTAMTDALVHGESIEIRGFGSFAVKHYGAFEGRNPKTGMKIQVKQKKLPFFKVGKELREKVNVKDKN